MYIVFIYKYVHYVYVYMYYIITYIATNTFNTISIQIREGSYRMFGCSDFAISVKFIQPSHCYFWQLDVGEAAGPVLLW